MDYTKRSFRLGDLIEPFKIRELRDWSELARGPAGGLLLPNTFFYFGELVNYFRRVQREERRLRKREFSYREFDVIAIAISALQREEPRVSVGQNFKPTKSWPETQCAELHALRRAMRYNQRNGQHDPVELMIVSGPPQEHPSGVESETLYPCQNCCEMFRLFLERGEAIKSDMVIVTVHPTKKICEVQIIKAMLRLLGTIK